MTWVFRPPRGCVDWASHGTDAPLPAGQSHYPAGARFSGDGPIRWRMEAVRALQLPSTQHSALLCPGLSALHCTAWIHNSRKRPVLVFAAPCFFPPVINSLVLSSCLILMAAIPECLVNLINVDSSTRPQPTHNNSYPPRTSSTTIHCYHLASHPMRYS